MGNSETKESTLDAPPEVAPPPHMMTGDDSYDWPSNLYEETRDMAAVSFLVYAFGLMLDVARKQGLKGMELNNEGQVSTTTRLHRTFTPQEVNQIIMDNRDVLAESYPVFERSKDGQGPTFLEKSLILFQERAQQSGMDRPLTLVEFDDKHQKEEMVYGVAKNDADKRITLVFRGTDNDLAMYNNWLTNAYVSKTKATNLAGVVKDKEIWFHKGFYDYIFSETVETEDDHEKTKYDEIVEDTKPLLQANPGYKLYVTGHSLGGALAGIAAFRLACEDEIPKPVTCISFASPRVGDYGYREATNLLEKMKQLRMLRVVNENDSIAVMPMINYKHAGFQLRLYKNTSTETRKPEITYPKLQDSYWNKLVGAWGNSLPASLNTGYDHSDYRERVEENQEFLVQEDLNRLYTNVDLAGFSWE